MKWYGIAVLYVCERERVRDKKEGGKEHIRVLLFDCSVFWIAIFHHWLAYLRRSSLLLLFDDWARVQCMGQHTLD